MPDEPDSDRLDAILDELARPPALGPESQAGDAIAHFRILSKIGQGGMGIVYKARDEKLGRTVALKLLPPAIAGDERRRARFAREARSAAAVSHPNIAMVFEVGEDGANVYIAMEWVEGTTLRERMNGRRADLEEALGYAVPIAEGLARAHEAGIVHRDLKPENVMVTPDGHVKVLDFGLAKPVPPPDGPDGGDSTVDAATAEGQVLGTPAYMSPEQARGQPVDVRSDVFAFGALLYELVSGQMPFRGETKVDTLVAVLKQTPLALPSLVPGVSGELVRIVTRCLEKDRTFRFASCAGVAEELRQLRRDLATRPGASTSHSQAEAVDAQRPHRGRALLVAGGVLGALALGAGVLLLPTRDPRGPAAPASATRSGRPSVAVLGFKNLSGHADSAWISTALAELSRANLAAGERIRTIPGETVARARAELKLVDADSFAPDTLVRVRANLGSDYIVVGSYLAAQGKVHVVWVLQDVPSGEIALSVSEDGSADDLPRLVANAGLRLRERLEAGGLSAVERAQVSASLPRTAGAARLYSEGLARMRAFDSAAAVNLLGRALVLEPDFALAHRALSEAYFDLGEQTKGRAQARQAFDLRAPLSREEQLLVEAWFHDANGEQPKAENAYRALWKSFPDNIEYGLKLAGSQWEAVRGDDALGTITALRRLPPPASLDARIDILEAWIASSGGDFARAMALLQRAEVAARAQGASVLVAEARLQQAKTVMFSGDVDRAEAALLEAERLYRAVGNRAGASAALHMLANNTYARGDAQKMLEYAEKGVALSRELGGSEFWGIQAEVWALVLGGNPRAALARQEESARLEPAGGHPAKLLLYLANQMNARWLAGNLAGALEAGSSVPAMCASVQAPILCSAGYGNLAEVNLAQGELSAADSMISKAMEQMGATPDIWTWFFPRELRLRLLVEQGQLAEAEQLGREILADRRVRGARLFQMMARDGVAGACLARGDLACARAESDAAMQLAAGGTSYYARLEAPTLAARVRAASKAGHDVAAATADLERIIGEAQGKGLAGHAFTARLALGEIEVASGRAAAGRARLAALAQEAKAKGFLLIERKAALARGGR